MFCQLSHVCSPQSLWLFVCVCYRGSKPEVRHTREVIHRQATLSALPLQPHLGPTVNLGTMRAFCTHLLPGQASTFQDPFHTQGGMDECDLGPGWQTKHRTVEPAGKHSTRYVPLPGAGLFPTMLLRKSSQYTEDHSKCLFLSPHHTHHLQDPESQALD